jgi:hypothetical protein
MPESVTDRPTRSHEYIFLLTKSQNYYYDHEAIKEPVADEEASPVPDLAEMITERQECQGKWSTQDQQSSGKRITDSVRTARAAGGSHDAPFGTTRNKRDVWTVCPANYPEAHFATYPPELITPCILAGSRPSGRRCDCEQIIRTPTGEVEHEDPSAQTGRAGMNRPRGENEGSRPICRRQQRSDARQLRESPHRAEIQAACGKAFDHYIRTDLAGARPLPENVRQTLLASGWLTEAPACRCPTQPADTVLDIFAGSGTTGQVALELGRNAVLIELNPEYEPLIRQRTAVTPGLAL